MKPYGDGAIPKITTKITTKTITEKEITSSNPLLNIFNSLFS